MVTRNLIKFPLISRFGLNNLYTGKILLQYMDEKRIESLEQIIESYFNNAETIRSKFRAMNYSSLLEGVTRDVWEAPERDILVYLHWGANSDILRDYRIVETSTLSEAELRFVRKSYNAAGVSDAVRTKLSQLNEGVGDIDISALKDNEEESGNTEEQKSAASEEVPEANKEASENPGETAGNTEDEELREGFSKIIEKLKQQQDMLE